MVGQQGADGELIHLDKKENSGSNRIEHVHDLTGEKPSTFRPERKRELARPRLQQVAPIARQAPLAHLL